jgi:hypothetical protein
MRKKTRATEKAAKPEAVAAAAEEEEEEEEERRKPEASNKVEFPREKQQTFPRPSNAQKQLRLSQRTNQTK